MPDSCSIQIISINIFSSAVRKAALVFYHNLTDKILHPLYHDQKTVTVFFHIFQICFAEISSVQNKSNVPVAIVCASVLDHHAATESLR